MLLNRKKYSEFGFIGDELFSDLEKDRMHKCMVAEQSIIDGDFTFDEAMQAYELNKDEYENYLAKKSNTNIFISLTGNTGSSIKINYPSSTYFEIFAKMILNSPAEQELGEFEIRKAKISEELFILSQDMKKAKEQV